MSDSAPLSIRSSPPATWICVGLPYLGLLMFATMALHVRFSFGRWPADAIDAGNMTVGMALHNFIFIVLYLAGAFGAGPLWLIFLCFRKLRITAQAHVIQAGLLGLGLFIIWFGPFELFPSDWVVWFLD